MIPCVMRMTTKQPHNLKPARCQGCNVLYGGVGMTYIHGRWLCEGCLVRERRGLPLPCDR